MLPNTIFVANAAFTHHYKRSDGKIGFNTGCIEGFDKEDLSERLKQVPGSTFSVGLKPVFCKQH